MTIEEIANDGGDQEDSSKMSLFPNWLIPERFRSYEDAMAFLEKPDWQLCIPVYIRVGDKIQINPEYKNARYEQRIVELDGKKVRALYKSCEVPTSYAFYGEGKAQDQPGVS